MPLPSDPVARHDVVAGEFAHLVEGTTDWIAPAPVDGWTARDVVRHLLTWLPGLLAAGEVTLPVGPSVDDDPAAAWRHHVAAVRALLRERGTEEFTHPHLGTQPLAQAIDRIYVSDVFMHSWDLARATSQQARLDEAFAADLLAGMRAMEEVLRGSGQYGAAVPVPDDAPVVDRLMGFVGRDPTRPSATS